MKKVILILAVAFGVATTVSANTPPAVAASLPADFKTEVTKHIDYPSFAKENFVEGEVWMKVTVDEASKVKIVDLSATNPKLGEHVKSELANVTLEKTSMKAGDVYFMKVKFDLTNM